MSERKEIRKYTFTVEGWTEKWYLEWLRDRINEVPEAYYTVSVDARVQQNPMKFAKTVNPIAVPCAVHICDYESNDDVHVQKFHGILDQLKDANGLPGRAFRYSLGYSNFTFELWMVLHKDNCNGAFANRTQYLRPINRAYGTQFENLDKYKQEDSFKWCLSKLTLDDVKAAIARAKIIMASNQENGLQQQQYRGFHYYTDNPALTIWESVESILRECKLI